MASLRLPLAMESRTSSPALPPEAGTGSRVLLGLSRRTNYEYDFAGNLVRRVAGDSLYPCEYSYDSLGRLVRIVTPGGMVARIHHDPAGRVVAYEDTMALRTVYEYDLHGHMTRVTFPDGTSRLIRYPAAPRGAGADERVQE